MNPRQHSYDPITPEVDGQAPGFIIMCLDCGFSVDAHGLTAEDAVTGVAVSHQDGHRLIAKSVNYLTGYGPDKTEPHPMYRR